MTLNLSTLNLSTLDYTLLNCYKRKYFETRDRKFRMTIDTNLEYYFLSHQKNTFLDKHEDHHNIVLEFKYSLKHNHLAHHVTQHLPFRITKSSKYVSGIETLSF